MKKPEYLPPLLAAALRGMVGLSPAQKADVYNGIAEVTRRHMPEVSRSASALAQAIRDAEGMQLHFQSLLSTDKA